MSPLPPPGAALGFFNMKAFIYRPEIVHRFKVSVKAAVLFCFMSQKQFKCGEDGWRLFNSSDITDGLGMTYKQQATARRQLVQAGLIEERYARLQHCIVFKIKEEAV